nr:ankyrin repeat, PH and SEC7 domain containing protein secG-like isoform X2 [Crassostrea gigas]
MEGLIFFKEPDVVLAEEIRGLRNTSKEKYCALILLILFNNDLRIEDIPGNKAVQEKYEEALNLCGMDTKTAAYLIGDELESLKGFLVKKIKDTYQFYHDFVMEVTTLIFGTDYPKTVIKYADIGFLRTRVRYDTGNKTPDKFTIYLSDRHIDALGDRLFSDIFGERLLDVVLNPCLQYESVKMVFEKKLENNSEKLQMLLKKIELQTDKQKLHQTTTNLHLSKLTFVHLENEVSCLFVLIVFGHTDLSLHCLKALKETQVNLTGISLFPAVCCNGSVELFNWFLKNNNECLTEKWEGLSPIHVVTVFHNSEILKQLIEKTTINVNLMIDKTNEPNPSLISTEKDKEINTDHTKGNASKTQNNKRKFLKSTKEDISLCLKDQTSSIHIACFDGCNSIVQILLSNGADVNLCDEKGRSPLYIASNNGHESTVQLLLSNGADINLCEEEGASPLYIACQNGHESTVQLLLSNGADINLCMEDKTSLLTAACFDGHESTVQLLLSNGADINLCMEDKTSPLTAACFDGHESTVQLLLSNGADINLCMDDGDSPLTAACFDGHDSTVQLLLSNGADINLCDTNGTGPLHIACQFGHDSTVQLLLNNGANINLCLKDKVSPLYIAFEKRHIKTINVLLNNGVDTSLACGWKVNPALVECFDKHDSTAIFLLQKDNISKYMYDPDSYFSLFVSCQVERVTRLIF